MPVSSARNQPRGTQGQCCLSLPALDGPGHLAGPRRLPLEKALLIIFSYMLCHRVYDSSFAINHKTSSVVEYFSP